ncbi:RNA polymerase-binding protein RbpA [uncultured Pseudokineococcus sp.]|uniref:RNA polymerase-binding protein RbpA n=1 Tax=uncultured Pseudokineococcus sp. TaxID=1642928 RepID=UPI00262A2230|nr:RNA polymerase-binding protein RbpA [uncultured Pseudokineococcus sp.]
MADRSLRGTRLGAASLESDTGVEPAPRQMREYVCSNEHRTVVPLSMEADVPALWECRCGEQALLRDASRPEEKAGKPPRTHWDMLLERRSVGDLQVLLDERLELLRSGMLHAKRSA